MRYRLWYAQLDVYDTVRRYLAVMSRWKVKPLSRDRLYVSDFYLANPSLLHKTHMTTSARQAFNALNVPRPDRLFLNYPSPSLLFNKMAGIQEEAYHNIVGRGLVELDSVERDELRLSRAGLEFASALGQRLIVNDEARVVAFLTEEFAQLGVGRAGLRAVTGLRRVGA